MAGSAANSAEVMRLLYTSGKYSDLVIECKGLSFNVHRAYVCLRSPIFARMIDGKFIEATTGVIHLPDNDPIIVEKMIYYMYHSDYSDNSKRDKEVVDATYLETNTKPVPDVDTNPLLLNTMIYCIAEQYNIFDLKRVAVKKYEVAIPQDWDAASFIASLRLMYDSTPENDRCLKTVALKAAGVHAKSLSVRSEFRELCKENGEIPFDILMINLFPPHTPLLGDSHCKRCGPDYPTQVVLGSRYCVECRAFG